MTPRPKTLLIPALLLPLLAACAPPGGGPRADEPPGPEPLPAAVLAALPPGVPASVVLADGSGCYLYSIERTDPPSGYPLRDAAGNQVCDPGAAPSGAPIATVAGLAADVAGSVPPSPVSPALPPVPAPDDEGPIDITPILTAPLPDAGADLATDAGIDAATGFGPGITAGDITPPAPIAPLN